MVTRAYSDDGEEYYNHSGLRSSKITSRKASIKWAHPVIAKLPLRNHSQNSRFHNGSVQANATEIPGSRSSSLGNESGDEDESPQGSAGHSAVLPPSNIVFERRRSLGSDPRRDAVRNPRKASGSFQRGRRRYSFAVGRDANQGLLAETWQIFVDDEERQEAAQLIEGDQAAYDPDQYELQSIVAALFDKNAALRHEIANIRSGNAESERQKELRHRRFLSVRMPGMLDKYDHVADDSLELEEKLISEATYHDPGEAKRNGNYPVKAQYIQQPKNRENYQLDDTTYDSPMTKGARRDGQNLIKAQHNGGLENRQRPRTDEEESRVTSDAKADRLSSKDAERMVELEKQLDDLTKRHNVFRQENLELKKKTRAIQAERDKFKFENFKLQRTRSDAQYEKLREQYQELQVQTQELLRQRQELLDMSKDMVSKMPGLRAVQTRNLRAHQMYWENERARAHKQSLGQIAEEGSSSSTDTLKVLTQNRTGPVQYANTPQDNPSAIGKENMNDVQPGFMSSDKTQIAVTDGIALRSRQGSTAPVAPGKGLEESRRNGPTPLKQRPGTIIRPTVQVRGLPKVATKGPPSYHRVRDQAQLHNTQSLIESSPKPSVVNSTATADYSGESSDVHIAKPIDISRMIAEISPNSPGSLAWHDIASQKYEHQDSPLSGLTPFFQMVRDPPIAIHSRGMVRYDIRGADEMYNIHEFKKGDQIFVYVDGMHDLWPVKLSEDSQGDVYLLPRNAISLVCDHCLEYTEIYDVIHRWAGVITYGAKSEFLPVACGERLHCAHSVDVPPDGEGQEIRTWRCMMSEDGKRRGWVPAEVLLKLDYYVAPPLTASLCPCTDPQPYASRARVLVDYAEASGQLSLKEGAEVDLSHLDTELGAYCVRDPETDKRGFIDATCLRLIRNPIHDDLRDNAALGLTPRILEFTATELRNMEVTEGEVKMAMRQRHEGLSDGAKQQWEQNLDGTNPEHKKFDEEMAKRRPENDNHWTRWKEEGLPPLAGHYVLKEDLATLKKFPRWKDSDLKDIDWKLFISTFPFNPIGPGKGTHRARSRSLPTLRNPTCLNEKEQEREGLMKRPPHIGHQPHRKVADGVCPDRDYISEPINGEPHDLKRKYIYFRDDGSMLACEEAETEINVQDLDFWKHYRKSGKDFTAWKKRGNLHMMPVEEDVVPFSFDDSVQSSGRTFAYVRELPEQIEEKADYDPLDFFRTQQKHGFNLVYGLRRDPKDIPVLAVHELTADDRFEIIDIPGPEMRNIQGYTPNITIRRVKTKPRAGADPGERFSANDASEDRKHLVSPSDLDITPFLRTAVFKDEQMPEHLMPQEREDFRFVLIRQPTQGPLWDSLHKGQIHSIKLSMMELEDTKLWKPLNSVLGQIQYAYRQKEVMDALEKEKDTEREVDFTASDPQIEDWDFWYPIIEGHTDFGDGFISIEGPGVVPGQPADYVQIIPGSENSGKYMCRTKHSNKQGLVHANAIDLRDPHLLELPFSNPAGNPSETYFILLKEEENLLFISSEHHAKGWIDRQDLSFDEENYQMVPLWEIFQEDVINVDDVEGAVIYLNETYGNEPAEDEKKQTRAVTTSEPIHRQQTSSVNTFQEMAGSPLRNNLGQMPLLSDSPGPPMSLYRPKSVWESGCVMPTALEANLSTGSQEQKRSGHFSADIVQSPPKSVPQDITVTQAGSRDETKQPDGSTSTSANNSDLSMIDLTLLEAGGTAKAPDVPFQTKPTQHANKSLSTPAKSGDVSGATEPDAEQAEGELTVVDPHDNEFLIRYDDWIKREEAFKDDPSTDNGQSHSNGFCKDYSVVRDVDGRDAAMLPDEASNIQHTPFQPRSTSDDTRASQMSQSGVRVHYPKKHGWTGLGQGTPDDTLNNSSTFHCPHRRLTRLLGDGLDLCNALPRGTRETTSTLTAPQTSADSRDSGVRLDSDNDENSEIASTSDVTYSGNDVDGVNIANPSTIPTCSSPSNTHPHHNELPGSPVSLIRVRPMSIPKTAETYQVNLSTSALQVISNIPPANPPPRPKPTPHLSRYPLTLLPARTTRLTMSPISSHTTLSELETTLQWLLPRLTLLIELFLSLNSPRSTLVPTSIREPRADPVDPHIGTGMGTENRKLSRWTLVYLLVLGYLLLSIWLARREWLDANGMGGIWGSHVVRGGHGRWVWGVYTG